MNDAANQGQLVLVCGVNSHHQNGKVERRIRQLQDLAITSLLAAPTKWPDAVNAYLWPYAIRKSAEDLNRIMHESKSESPYEAFTQAPILPDIQNAHPFGCPVYVLNSKLQQGQKISKWDARANLGVYLGTSAIHASLVGLILSLRTGLVSPSFHNAYDDKFVTVSSPFGKLVPKSQWQVKCVFHEDPNLMNLTMQPISNQQSAPSVSSRSHDISTSGNNADHDNQVTEGDADYVFDVQPIEAIYEGPDTIEKKNETIHNVAPTEESKAQAPATQTITRSGRASRRPRKYDDFVSYST
jgi:hypothetical protein